MKWRTERQADRNNQRKEGQKKKQKSVVFRCTKRHAGFMISGFCRGVNEIFALARMLRRVDW
jgi:hypothetical protein